MDKRPKQDLYLRHFVGAGIFAIGFVMLSAMAIGGDPLSLNDWLYRWQTMIAGIFAVGAAFFTIRKMEETDKEAAKRHRQVVQLQMRADGMLIERAYRGTSHDAYAAIRIINANIERAKSLIPEHMPTSEDMAYGLSFADTQGLGYAMKQIFDHAYIIWRALTNAHIIEARNLYSAYPTADLDSAVASAAYLKGCWEGRPHQAIATRFTLLSVFVNEAPEQKISRVLETAEGLTMNTMSFYTRLGKLHDEYSAE